MLDVWTWSVVCSEALHSQFGKGMRPHLCIDEWNFSTLVHRQLSLTEAVWSQLNGKGLALVMGMKSGAWMYFHNTPCSICNSSPEMHRCLVWKSYLKDFTQLAHGCLDLNLLLGKHLKSHLKDHVTYGQGPEIHVMPRKVCS